MASQIYRLQHFAHDAGYAYVSQLPTAFPIGDTAEDPVSSPIELFEDGKLLGPAHSPHERIRNVGRGHYSHWHGHLYVSASDNSDPRRNHRYYDIYVPGKRADLRRARLETLVASVHDGMSPWDTYRLAESLFYEIFPSGFIGEFGKACWEDAEFVADYERLVPGNRRSFERKYVVAQFVRAVKHVAGDMAECGVYNGATAYFMARATEQVGVPRALHLFDSFDGLSEPGPKDGSYWQTGALAMAEETARDTLKEIANVAYYKGWIPDRFSEVSDRQFAFVHIDVDLYQPTLDALRFFYPRTPRGAVLLCDDYGFITCPGAAQAMQEFMLGKTEEIIHLPTGQAVVIRT